MKLSEDFKSFLRAMFIIALCVFSAIVCNAQNYTRNGNEFVAVAKAKAKSEPTKTVYTWKDKDGNIYPIYKSSKGACFIIKTSKKTGKEYKQYLPKAIIKEMQ